MKKQAIFAACAAIAVTFCGCYEDTEMFDAGDPTKNTARSLTSVSQAECMMAARTAVMDAMSSPAFNNYLVDFRKEGGSSTPLLQVGTIRNDTNDPDLNMSLITDEITKTLRDAGKVRVTLATGSDVKSTFADARDLKRDKNFDQSTVAKSGTLRAPRLSVEGKIITTVIRDGRRTSKVTSFNMKMADIKTGEEIWSYNKPLGFNKKQKVMGF